ncbi:MAG: metalloregulator ArsR/SmtB family transcription factor [Pseudomonadota bacterium]
MAEPDPEHRLPQAVIDRAAGMLRAGGDPARLRILELLMSGERQVSEIAQLSDAEMSTTSQRLKILLNENLVKRRREGRDMFYRLSDCHVETLVRNVLDHADPNVTTDS